MTEHPGIDKISFTGSVATGKKVMASAAATLKRVTLELGGNDAAIVLDDVDPKAIAPKLFFAAFVNSGQVCMAIKRIYAHEKHLRRALRSARRRSAQGQSWRRARSRHASSVRSRTAMQYDKVVSILEDTKRSGARFLAGGDVPERPGLFLSAESSPTSTKAAGSCTKSSSARSCRF